MCRNRIRSRAHYLLANTELNCFTLVLSWERNIADRVSYLLLRPCLAQYCTRHRHEDGNSQSKELAALCDHYSPITHYTYGVYLYAGET